MLLFLVNRLQAFEFSHILVLFIAGVYVLQASLLTLFVQNQRKRLYRIASMSESDMLGEYCAMRLRAIHPTADSMVQRFLDQTVYYLFHHSASWFPYPRLRDEMEYRIVEEYFVRTFYLPTQFSFSEYMALRFKHHIIRLVEVRDQDQR